MLILCLILIFSPQPSNAGAALPQNLTYTVERHVRKETVSQAGESMDRTTDERFFRGSLEAVAITSTPKPLPSEEEFVSDLRSAGSSSTPFTAASTKQASVTSAYISPRMIPLPESVAGDTTDYGSPKSSSEESLAKAKRFLRAKRKIAFAGRKRFVFGNFGLFSRSFLSFYVFLENVLCKRFRSNE